jgi:lipid-A-disaccharide synthase
MGGGGLMDAGSRTLQNPATASGQQIDAPVYETYGLTAKEIALVEGGQKFMLIAGEASGDLLAAELVRALRPRLAAANPFPPRFFGAGRRQMAEAGVEIAMDMTPFGVVGFSDVVKRVLPIRRAFQRLFRLALERQPDVIIGVDYGGFNLRFAAAIRRHLRARTGAFLNWQPKLVQLVSPQVWASRASRALGMERDLDMLLTIFPFEPEWYAQRVPKLRVQFVGHPIFDRYPQAGADRRGSSPFPPASSLAAAPPAHLLLLPGSRPSELKHHLPVMLAALKLIQAKLPTLQTEIVLPGEALLTQARALGLPPEVATGSRLDEALARATTAIASTGTVTVECAYFGVPTVTLYKTSWSTYAIGKRVVKVKSLTMPNLLAGKPVFPEFIQDQATPQALAEAALALLTDTARRAQIQAQLRKIIASLGGPGAAPRAAEALADLLAEPGIDNRRPD